MPEAQPTVVAPPEPCARCGADADFEIAELWLCVDCYHVAGSTCGGIGRIPGTSPSPGAARVAEDTDDALGPADQVC